MGIASKNIVVLPSQIVMVRPKFFGFNAETSETNLFQKDVQHLSAQAIHDQAIEEFEGFLAMYRAQGIDVAVHDARQVESSFVRPDEVFPNCVVCFSGKDLDGLERLGASSVQIDKTKTYAVAMPMLVESRRRERPLMLEYLYSQGFEIVDDFFEEGLEGIEKQGRALEGTGALVLDYAHKIVYCAISQRADKALAEEFARGIGFELVSFETEAYKAMSVYHTDLLMHIGGAYHNICAEMIAAKDRERVVKKAQEYRDVYELSNEQFCNFCGNSQPVVNAQGQEFLAMSRRAHDAFGDLEHILKDKHDVQLISSPIEMLETAGGGSGCCLSLEARHKHI